jgi:hypothetical protein
MVTQMDYTRDVYPNHEDSAEMFECGSESYRQSARVCNSCERLKRDIRVYEDEDEYNTYDR